MVVENELLTWYLQAGCDYELYKRVEVALRRGYLLWVDVAALECGKIDLCRARLISIGPYHAHWQSEFLDQLLR